VTRYTSLCGQKSAEFSFNSANGSTEHQLEVYLQESQQLKSFASVEPNRTLPWLGLIDHSRTDRLSSGKYCRINSLDGVALTG